MQRSDEPARVVVVGAGVSGLLSARRLRDQGCEVTVVEASERIGGHVRTIDLDGRHVDVGAESLHLGAPAARELVADLGLTDEVVAAGSAPSWLWTAKGRRVLPAGVGPAGPTRLRPVLRSGVLGLPALARAGLEPVLARTGARLPDDPEVDVSVGDFVGGRFGAQVREAFVDPLLGGLHSGDVSRLSLRACTPSLVPAATSGHSLILKSFSPKRLLSTPDVLRRRRATPAVARSGPPPVMFASFAQGLSRLTEALADGGDVRLGRTVTRIERDEAHGTTTGSSRYVVYLDQGDPLAADAIVLAVPAPAAADLVRPHAPQTADRLADVTLASTATIVLGFRPADVASLEALTGNGILVPSRYGSTVKAATHLSTKWPHLVPPADSDASYLVRVSVGRAGSGEIDRLDDEELLARVRSDLQRFVGITAEPTLAHVQRWRVGLPQLEVGHVARLQRTRAELAEAMPGVVLAGASYDGVGLTACITSATSAAAEVTTSLSR